MFSPHATPSLARRLLGGLRLIRSFLLLEDDYSDWEVELDEHVEPSECRLGSTDQRQSARGAHPHRTALPSRPGARRPGTPAPREQVCVCPVNGRVRAGVSHGSSPLWRSCAQTTRS